MLIEECEELIFSDICHQPRAQICGCHNMYQIKYHPDNEKSLYAACQHSKEPVDSFQNRKLHHQIQHIQNNMKNQIYHHICHYAGNQAVGHMQFQVSPKKTVFQRLIKPIEKKLKADAKEKNEKKPKKWPIICMIFIPFLAIAVLIYYKKRKKNGFFLR